jgi:hypothetical protein
MSDSIRVNGNQLSWGSIVCKVASEPIYGFTSISFSDKRERVKAYGMGRHQAPRGRSRGKYSADPIKLAGWRSAVAELRKRLADLSPDGKSYGDVEFQVVTTYFETDEMPLIVVAERCVWVSNSATDEEGAENLKEEVELDPMFIRRNGLVLFDNSGAGL